MLRKLVLPLFVVSLLIWAAGCSNSPSEPDTSQTTNLADKFGGYTPTNEAPAFGDTELLAADNSEAEYDDPVLTAAGVSNLLEDPESGLFHFRAVWGQLTYDSSVTDQTDWSGSLTISRGAEIIRRVVAFELGQDYIPTRTDRKVIEWVSYTTTHYDGIVVDLVVPPPVPTYDTTETQVVDSVGDTTTVITVDTLWPDPVTVAFETGPYSRTFTLGELASLDTVVYLDDADSNAIAFTSVQQFHYPCARGILAGEWGYDSTGQGVFRGRWMTRNGRIAGHLHGTFGKNDNGDKVFFGKWINRSGKFEGLLRGTYKEHPNRHANRQAFIHAGGWFKGLIYDANETEIGALEGKYNWSRGVRGSFFQGRWKLFCDSQSTDQTFNYDDNFDETDDAAGSYGYGGWNSRWGDN